MSHVIAKNVNQALIDGLFLLKLSGVEEASRNGPVLVNPGPMLTTYSNPTERVLQNPTRDANPVFHLIESLWMLAGLDDAKLIERFNSNIINYAEDDGRMHGAYGHRWRETFGMDQIHKAIQELQRDPASRRVVVQMWSAALDLGADKRDLPCNTHVYFDCRGGAVNMTVCNRSNDVIWGAYGANVVHFSMLQEVVAAGVGLPVGKYHQFSNNFHVYLDNPLTKSLMETVPLEVEDPYESGHYTVQPLVGPDESFRAFLHDCFLLFAQGPFASFATAFFRDTVVPLWIAYLSRKVGSPINWHTIPGNDWGVAFREWVERRDGPIGGDPEIKIINTDEENTNV